jgi:hypothetical protein
LPGLSVAGRGEAMNRGYVRLWRKSLSGSRNKDDSGC